MGLRILQPPNRIWYYFVKRETAPVQCSNASEGYGCHRGRQHKPRHNFRYLSSELSRLTRLLKITTYGSQRPRFGC